MCSVEHMLPCHGHISAPELSAPRQLSLLAGREPDLLAGLSPVSFLRGLPFALIDVELRQIGPPFLVLHPVREGE